MCVCKGKGTCWMRMESGGLSRASWSRRGRVSAPIVDEAAAGLGAQEDPVDIRRVGREVGAAAREAVLR